MTEKEKMMAGFFYDCYDEELVCDRNRVRELTYDFNHCRPMNWGDRDDLLSFIFPNSKNVPWMEPMVSVEYGYNFRCGKRCYFNFNTMINDLTTIESGDDVLVGMNCVFATAVHPMLSADRNSYEDKNGDFHEYERAKPIKVGNGVWIASGVTICPGVTIGDNVVIGAGSVVTRNIHSNSFAAGAPCKVIRTLTEADKIAPEILINNK